MARVAGNSISKAISLDNQGDYQLAIHQYVSSMHIMLEQIIRLQPIVWESDPLPTTTASSLRELTSLTGDCWSRVKDLLTDRLSGNLPPRSPSPYIESVQNSPEHLTFKPSKSPSPSPSQSQSQSPSPSPSHQVHPSLNQVCHTGDEATDSRISQILLQAHYENKRLIERHSKKVANLSDSEAAVDRALMLARRCVENVALARLNQRRIVNQLLDRKRQEAEEAELKAARRVKEIEDKMAEAQKAAEKYDLKWKRQIASGDGDRDAIQSHLELNLRTPQHPFGRLVQDWSADFNKLFGSKYSELGNTNTNANANANANTNANADPKTNNNTHNNKAPSEAMKEVHSYSRSLQDLILATYPDLATTVGRDMVAAAVEQALMPPVYNTLLALICEQTHEHDEVLWQRMQQFQLRGISSFGITGSFLLDERSDTSELPYHEAIKLLRRLPEMKTVSLKLACIADSLQSLCSAATACSSAPLTIGADDMLNVFTWVVVHSQVPNLKAEVAFMTEFILEAMLLGQEGYALATLDTAVEQIFQTPMLVE